MAEVDKAPVSLLTDEEKAALLAAGEREKQLQLEASARAKQAEEEAKIAAAEQAAKEKKEAKARKENPLKFVGVWVGPDSVAYYPNMSPQNDRTIVVGNVSYEHTHEDADGVWVYRALDRK